MGRTGRNGFFSWAEAIYFFAAGLFLALAISLGGPSLWYFVCACMLMLAGIIWPARPGLAAGLSVVPVLGLALILRVCTGAFCVYYAAILFGAAIFICVEYRYKAARKLYPIVISSAVVLASIATDKLFTNVKKVVVVQMEWSDDGHAPWGSVGPPIEDGQPLVVLYRRVGGSYCYDSLYSSTVRDQLEGAHQKSIPVEYNTFRDFGSVRSTNIRSVNGLILNDGPIVSQGPGGFHGQVLSTAETVERQQCW